jgi:hypothetical protein
VRMDDERGITMKGNYDGGWSSNGMMLGLGRMSMLR